MGGEAEIRQAVPHHLLRLHDAAAEQGLDGRHIQAWLEFEHEAMRLGFSTEISRRDLERRVRCPECARRWRARGCCDDDVWRAVAGDLYCSECDSEGEVL